MTRDLGKDKDSEDGNNMAVYYDIDVKNVRYPFCIVWTPIPLLTWIFPFIGHMGICTSAGVVRDFAGSHVVGEDNMAFGNPVKYWKLDPKKITGGAAAWDQAISEAADAYKTRSHNLLLDNCHSMVALALNKMNYDSQQNWGMVKLAVMSFFSLNVHFISCWAWIKTYFPFFVIVGCTTCAYFLTDR